MSLVKYISNEKAPRWGTIPGLGLLWDQMFSSNGGVASIVTNIQNGGKLCPK